MNFIQNSFHFFETDLCVNFPFMTHRLTSNGLLVETSAWNATPSAKRQKNKECDIVLVCISKHSLKDSEQAMEIQNLVAESKAVTGV